MVPGSRVFDSLLFDPLPLPHRLMLGSPAGIFGFGWPWCWGRVILFSRPREWQFILFNTALFATVLTPHSNFGSHLWRGLGNGLSGGGGFIPISSSLSASAFASGTLLNTFWMVLWIMLGVCLFSWSKMAGLAVVCSSVGFLVKQNGTSSWVFPS